MAQTQQKLNASNPVIEPDGTMTQVFRGWVQLQSSAVPIAGIGDPEGRFTAPRYSFYIDETTPTSPVVYIKTQDQIDGDKMKGWALI